MRTVPMAWKDTGTPPVTSASTISPVFTPEQAWNR